VGATAPRCVVDFWGMKGDLRQGVGFGGGRGFFISTHFDEQRTYEDFAIRIAKPCSRAEIAHCMARQEHCSRDEIAHYPDDNCQDKPLTNECVRPNRLRRTKN